MIKDNDRIISSALTFSPNGLQRRVISETSISEDTTKEERLRQALEQIKIEADTLADKCSTQYSQGRPIAAQYALIVANKIRDIAENALKEELS